MAKLMVLPESQADGTGSLPFLRHSIPFSTFQVSSFCPSALAIGPSEWSNIQPKG